ncbi:MAG TPA: hypothetical protein VH969_32995 [Actinophytocola sp.]|uniref:DUF6882 domain-containing protein n=1 Tax=Actinophytocola sp. TaxID=1872138 RepID=UPI002F93934A
MPTFTELLDDAALLSFEHQLHLADVLGDHSWHVDLARPAFDFTGATPRTCSRVHLLGSAAPGPGTWLWGWANPTDYPTAVIGLGEYVRDFGRRHAIPELAEPEVPFASLPGSPGDPHLVAGMFLEAAKAVSNVWTSYCGEVAGGTRAAFLLEHPDFALPPPDPARVTRILTETTAELELRDPRRALHSYAARRGLNPAFDPNGSRLTMSGPGLALTVHFGPDGRVGEITSSMGAATS